MKIKEKVLNFVSNLSGEAQIIWSGLWKGLALWRAARLKQVGWYIALIIINTLGVLEIIYLIATRKKYQETNGCVS